MSLRLTRSPLLLLFMSLAVAARSQSITKATTNPAVAYDDPAKVFLHPPETAKPGVLWMWMGSNISREGITKDLEALKSEGFGRATLFSLADITMPWAADIGRSPTPEIVSFTEPWWKLIRYAAQEAKRLKIDFGIHNCPGYEASGGDWITPELSMQELCWSSDTVTGGKLLRLQLSKPVVDPHANQDFPIVNHQTQQIEKPLIQARNIYYRDIEVVALPATGIVPKDSVIILTGKMQADGNLVWEAPAGQWIIYRFGHTTKGTIIQPAQWQAAGLECDKMSEKAVSFHIDHVIGEIQKHLGDLIGTGITHVHFDSYEAGDPTWTPKMSIEFSSRRGYNLTPYLAAFAGRCIQSAEDSVKFMTDFNATVKDLYRDVYFKTLARKIHAAHLAFLCEPYGGPWRQEDVLPFVDQVMAEFWTHGGSFSPYLLYETVTALRQAGQNTLYAEAFTGDPSDSKWDETPEWLKPIGDAAFCAGVNRFVLHRFVEQPWDDRYLPGATMGRWGTHFDRTQTWWKQGKAMIAYWQRCQALLQWGRIAPSTPADFTPAPADSITVNAIHRVSGSTHVYFVANTARRQGSATCRFAVTGLQPELWDPVTMAMRPLPQFEERQGATYISLTFEKAQSLFIVFRNKRKTNGIGKSNFPVLAKIKEITGPWKVQFDPKWGGPIKPVVFDSLTDWTLNPDKGIKYFSGTSIYEKTFDLAAGQMPHGTSAIYIDLGTVRHIAHVFINGVDAGVIWTAPWRLRVPAGLLRSKQNQLRIEVANVWANRLIGDEQEPADCEWLPGDLGGGQYLKEFPDWFLTNQPRPSKNRYCFTTWNYFTKDSKLISSGLLGPVCLLQPPHGKYKRPSRP